MPEITLDLIFSHQGRILEELKRVLWNDPATGVMRHADAGYDIAIACAREHGLDLPMLGA